MRQIYGKSEKTKFLFAGGGGKNPLTEFHQSGKFGRLQHNPHLKHNVKNHLINTLWISTIGNRYACCPTGMASAILNLNWNEEIWIYQWYKITKPLVGFLMKIRKIWQPFFSNACLQINWLLIATSVQSPQVYSRHKCTVATSFQNPASEGGCVKNLGELEFF